MATQLHWPLQTKDVVEVEHDSWTVPKHKPEPIVQQCKRPSGLGGMEGGWLGQHGHLGPLDGVSVSVD